MKKIKIFSLILGITFLICAIYLFWQLNRTIIVLENQRSQEFKNVEVKTRNNDVIVHTLLPNSRYTIVLPNKFGESDVTIFLDGHEWIGGYIEDHRRAKIIISDTGIRFEDLSIQVFLLRM